MSFYLCWVNGIGEHSYANSTRANFPKGTGKVWIDLNLHAELLDELIQMGGKHARPKSKLVVELLDHSFVGEHASKGLLL